MNFQEFLVQNNANDSILPYEIGKTFAEYYADPYADLLWLFAKTNPKDVRLRVLAAAKGVEKIFHIMKDNRSTAAVFAAAEFGQGKIDEKQLAFLANNANYADFEIEIPEGRFNSQDRPLYAEIAWKKAASVAVDVCNIKIDTYSSAAIHGAFAAIDFFTISTGDESDYLNRGFLYKETKQSIRNVLKIEVFDTSHFK
jgi:hypothetical protein